MGQNTPQWDEEEEAERPRASFGVTAESRGQDQSPRTEERDQMSNVLGSRRNQFPIVP